LVHRGTFPYQTTPLAPSSAFQRVLSTAGEPSEAAIADELFIGGLAFSTSSERLREVYVQAAAVESATVVMDQDTGHSRGFGFAVDGDGRGGGGQEVQRSGVLDGR